MTIEVSQSGGSGSGGFPVVGITGTVGVTFPAISGGVNPVGITGLVGLTGTVGVTFTGITLLNPYLGVTFTGVSILNFPASFGVSVSNFPLGFGASISNFPASFGVSVSNVGFGASVTNTGFGASVTNTGFGASITNTGLGVTFPQLGVTFQATGLGVTFPPLGVTFQAIGLGVTFVQNGSIGITGFIGITGTQLHCLGTTLGKSVVFKTFSVTTGATTAGATVCVFPATINASTTFFMQGYEVSGSYATATAVAVFIGTMSLQSPPGTTLTLHRINNLSSGGVDRASYTYAEPMFFGASTTVQLVVNPGNTNLIQWTGNIWGYQK